MPCRIIDDKGVCSENACHSHMKNLLQLMRMCTAWPLMMVIIDMASTLTPSVLHRFRYLIIPKIVSWYMTPQELMEGVVNALLTIRQSLTTKW